MERKNIILTEEEGGFALTIMYPMSHEYEGRLFVIYEDSLGDADFKIMTPKAIAKNYNVDFDEINLFIESVKEDNKKEDA